ncbi:hypothetical protein H0H93_001048, partial [Arthromyces matolae]
ARHSRQASLGGRLVKQQQQQQQQQEVQAQRMGMGMGMGKFGQGKVEDVLEEEEKEIVGSAEGDRDREDASEVDKEAKNGRVAMEGAGEVKRKGVVPVVEEEREEGEVANTAPQGVKVPSQNPFQEATDLSQGLYHSSSVLHLHLLDLPLLKFLNEVPHSHNRLHLLNQQLLS